MTAATWDRHATADPYGTAVGRVGDGLHRWADRNAFWDTGVAEVERYLPDGRRFHRGLDVGCGPGRHLLALAAHADSVVGFDWSPVMRQEAARTARPAQNVTIASQLAPMTDAGSFDLIWCRLVVQHQATSQACIELLDAMAAVLAHPGTMVVQVLHGRTARARAVRRVAGALRWRVTNPGLPRLPMTAVDDEHFAQWRERHALSVREAVADRGARGWRSMTYVLERA